MRPPLGAPKTMDAAAAHHVGRRKGAEGGSDKRLRIVGARMQPPALSASAAVCCDIARDECINNAEGDADKATVCMPSGANDKSRAARASKPRNDI
jgi:hypothetical protein